MTPEQFVYWLQGYLEMQNPATLDFNKTQMIKDHLKTVFNKVTPDIPTEKVPTPYPVSTPSQSPSVFPDWKVYEPYQPFCNPHVVTCNQDMLKTGLIC